jgi:hypothetical protein
VDLPVAQVLCSISQGKYGGYSLAGTQKIKKDFCKNVANRKNTNIITMPQPPSKDTPYPQGPLENY